MEDPHRVAPYTPAAARATGEGGGVREINSGPSSDEILLLL